MARNIITLKLLSPIKRKRKRFSCVQYHHTIGVKGIDKETNTEINADEAALVFFDYFTGVKGFQGALTDRSVIYTSNVKELKNSVEHLQKGENTLNT